jgi:glycine/D-amino acid oxidase-like deaminating enzyme
MTGTFDAVVIGGGFYGAAISIYLSRKRGFTNVLLVEREAALLQRASYNNQARIHNGYHYPRSFTTAYRSRVNLPRFLQDHPLAAKKDFHNLYAIARNNSKITSQQFQRFCTGIGAKLEPLDSAQRHLFEPRLIEEIFIAEEYAFDSTKLAAWACTELAESEVQSALSTTVSAIRKRDDKKLDVSLESSAGDTTVSSRYVFNCAYSGLNQIGGDFPGIQAGIKHEMTEMALIRPPPSLSGLGVTVMDGPFFSMMPFPARGLHTLSHVRYTPHYSWHEQADIKPYEKLATYHRQSRADRMLRDVARYMPDIRLAHHVDSLFEVKTVLLKNEADDGRPIFFEQHTALPGCFSILGGKIDNIYDVIEKLDEIEL